MLWTCRLLSAPDADRRASRPGGWLWFACEPRSWGRSDGLRPCRRDGSRTVVRKRTTATRRIKPNRASNQTQSRVESNPFLAPNQTQSRVESNPIARRIKPNRASNQTHFVETPGRSPPRSRPLRCVLATYPTGGSSRRVRRQDAPRPPQDRRRFGASSPSATRHRQPLKLPNPARVWSRPRWSSARSLFFSGERVEPGHGAACSTKETRRSPAAHAAVGARRSLEPANDA